jgi:hypothetical protein
MLKPRIHGQISGFFDLESISLSNTTDDESTIWLTLPLSISVNSMLDDCAAGTSEGTLGSVEREELGSV